jgi:hypothetical protein
MADQGTVLLKILALSAALSLFIRYVVPLLNLPATSAVALVLVLAPPLMIGAILGWRNWSSRREPVR